MSGESVDGWTENAGQRAQVLGAIAGIYHSPYGSEAVARLYTVLSELVSIAEDPKDPLQPLVHAFGRPLVGPPEGGQHGQ